MLDNIGQTAVRTLGIDIANLSSRLAVSQAILDEIMRVASSFELTRWKHEPIQGDTPGLSPVQGRASYITTLPGEEAEKLEELLRIIRELQQMG